MRSLFLVFALVVLLGSAATASFDLAANFPASQGQNGIWAQAYNPSTSSFRDLEVITGGFGTPVQPLNMPYLKIFAEGIKALPCWNGATYGTEWPAITYMAPQTGVYLIQGAFSNANDIGATTRGLVFKNRLAATPLFAGNVTKTAPAVFDLKVSLLKGDCVRFAVDPLGNAEYDNTWLNGVVSTPEPGSLMAFATGLIGFAGLTRRRFRK